MRDTNNGNGWHVETGTADAWYLRREDADSEVARLLMLGAWSGMPPRVTPGRDMKARGMGAAAR